MSDMSLKVLHAEGTHDEPKLERTEPAAEWNLPVLYPKQKETLFDKDKNKMAE